MRTLREWTRRLLGTLRRGRTDSDLEEELRAHLELAAEDARRRGREVERRADDVARAARMVAGGTVQAMEALRDQRGVPWIEDLVQDVRHGMRSLRRTPVFAAVAIVTLALGIGANTAIFSIVHGVLLRPLAYPRPAQLMYLGTRTPAFHDFPTSVAEYLELQRFARSFAGVGAFRTGQANLLADDRALRVRSAIVDAALLQTLGVQPIEGRLFTPEDTGLVSPPPAGLVGDGAAGPLTGNAALIAYELWQSVFGAQPIVGRSIDVDGRRLQVVGIMPPGADLMDHHPEIWLPLGFTEDERGARNNHTLHLIARVKDGVTIASAQTELHALLDTWSARAFVPPGEGHAGHVFRPAAKGADGGHVLQMTPLADRILGRASTSIWILQAAVGLVLLIACVNVTNLLLARAETRHREFALLTALGASRGRLLRKALTESVILAIAGGALGMLLARAGVMALLRAYPASLPRIGEVAVDPRVMLISLVVAIGCGLLFGLAPLRHTRADAASDALKSGSRGSTGTTRHRMRRALVVAETALAVIVVVAAGLLLRTVRNLTAVDAGFDRSRLVTFSITLPPASADLLGRARAYQRLLDRVRALPGVRMATAITDLPLENPLSAYQTEIANNTATPGVSLTSIHYYQRVMSDYFETMDIPIVQGRGFQVHDAAAPGRVAVVNETLANTYWKGRNPIGQRLRACCGGGERSWFTVIGVAKDVKEGGVDQPVGTEAYVLVDQLATDSPTTWLAFSPTTMNVVVRTGLPLSALAPTLARVVRDVDPAVPVARLREMDEVFTESIGRPRLLAQLLALFSALALVLAAIGTYGVLASMMAERRHEMGIRLALGANRSRLVRQVMAPGLALACAGVALGLAGALAVSRLLTSLLFGVQPTDVVTLAIVIPSIVATAALACWLPAWRVSRVDPNVVLRAD